MRDERSALAGRRLLGLPVGYDCFAIVSLMMARSVRSNVRPDRSLTPREVKYTRILKTGHRKGDGAVVVCDEPVADGRHLVHARWQRTVAEGDPLLPSSGGQRQSRRVEYATQR